MSDHGLDLFKAIRVTLIANGPVAADVGNRIITDWSQTPNTPFIRLHVPEERDFEADCADGGTEHRLHVHIYTAEDAAIVCKRIARNVRKALDGTNLSLDSSECWWIDYEATIHRVDPDSPLLQTARVEFTAVTSDPAP